MVRRIGLQQAKQGGDDVPPLQGHPGLSDASEGTGVPESRGEVGVQDPEHHDGARDTRWRDDRMTGRRSHGRLSALNGVVHQGTDEAVCACPTARVRGSMLSSRTQSHDVAPLLLHLRTCGPAPLRPRMGPLDRRLRALRDLSDRRCADTCLRHGVHGWVAGWTGVSRRPLATHAGSTRAAVLTKESWLTLVLEARAAQNRL